MLRLRRLFAAPRLAGGIDLLVGEEALEAEEARLEEAEAAPGECDGEGEKDGGGEDDSEEPVGEKRVEVCAQRQAEAGEKRDVEDVESVAVFAQPA